MASDDGWVIISGAAGALGRALAEYYTGNGRRVLALDRRFDPNYKPVETMTVRALDLVVEADVRQALTDSLGPREKISLLVNAVGQIWNEPLLTFRQSKFVTHSLGTWRSVIEANLTAPFVVATQVAAIMARRGGGAIVNFSSVSSDGNLGQAAYSAAKAGIEGLTRTMAIELGPLGLRVNAVSLGFIDVGTTRDAVPDCTLKSYTAKTPLGRLGQLDDVVNAVEFLASNAFVNGAIVKVDGGLRL